MIAFKPFLEFYMPVRNSCCIDFAHLAAEIDHVVPRPVSKKGGRPPFPTETMVRILVLKRI
ncbi:hypothetical protein CBG25_11050, partial [Arsenophonus sp. ENCA]